MNIPFMSVNANILITQVIIASIEVVGIVQFMKNFCVGFKKRGLAVLCLVLSLTCGFMNSHHIPEANTTFFNIVAMTLAVSQLGWTIIANTIPKALNNFIYNKLGNGGEDKNGGTGK